MRQGDSLKSYIGYFQSQLVKVFNCEEDVSALAFISGLQISQPLYKHLLKQDVTRMSKVLSQAQLYVQLEETMKSSANHSLKRGNDREKINSQLETLIYASNQNRGQPAFKKQAFPILYPDPL